MKYLQAGMKLRRKPKAVSRSWWTKGKEYKVFETGHDWDPDFYILDDDGDATYFDFNGESFTGNSEVIGNFEVVGELYEEPPAAVEEPPVDPLQHTKAAIKLIEADIRETESGIKYSQQISHAEDTRRSIDEDYLKLDLLHIQLRSMNLVLKDLEEYFKHE